MQVRFWGVRGSYPVPGVKTVRYGGNTPCVEICPDDGSSIIVDAGTGIRRLGQHLAARGIFKCHLLISHTHWDHIQGLPFFSPLYAEGSHLTIYARQRDVHLHTLFASQTADPYFPISLKDVEARVEYRELIEGATFAIGGTRVRCARLNHPYIAIGYRLEADGVSVAYVSDTAPFDRILLGYEFISQRPDLTERPSGSDAAELAAMRQGVVELCRDADFVIYDTMFEMNEYLDCPHWGHSAPAHALEVVEEAGAKALALFHHAPGRSDDEQDAIVERTQQQTDVRVLGAAERKTYVVTPSGTEVAEGPS